jgi:hypothetical protein
MAHTTLNKLTQNHRFMNFLLPLGLIALALIALNAGLYLRLAPKPPATEQASSAPAQAVSMPTSEPTAAATAQPAVAVQPATAPPTTAGDVPLLERGELVNSSGFDETDASTGWTLINGDWSFQDGALVQQRFEGYDYGAVNDATFDTVSVRTTFTHQEGAGGGLLFNLPEVTTKHGGHMVRFVEDGGGVMWGYFGEDGVFNGQGYAPTANPGTDAHTLEVRAGADTYDIYLDDEVLGREVPLFSRSGHVGLVTAQSIVAFDNIEFYNLVQPPITPQAEPEVASQWRSENGVITQTDPTQTDFVYGTGVAGETFRVSVDVAIEGESAGGGLIFHMLQRDTPAQGAMVRFSAGGREVFWGSYDAAGVFQGAGNATLDLPVDGPHKLTIAVRAGNYDILVNDQEVATSVPLARDSGWIGLISFGGPVTFSNLSLKVE